MKPASTKPVYKEGQIVRVPLELRPVKVNKDRKSYLSHLEEKKKGIDDYIIESEIYEGEAVDEEANFDDDKNLRDQEEDQSGEEDYGDEPVDEDDESKSPKKKEDENVEEMTGEEIIKIEDYSMEKVKMFKNPDYEQFVLNMGLDVKKHEYVKKVIKMKADRAKLVYTAFDFMIYKNGKLVPYKPYSDRSKLYDEDPIKPKVNESYKPQAREIEENKYNGEYNFGDYVRFVNVDGKEIQGIIMSCTESGVGVMPRTSKGASMTFVNYDDPSLNKIPKPPKLQGISNKELTIDDVYTMTSIPTEIRDMVKKTYIKILDSITSISEDEKGEYTAPVAPSSMKKNLKAEMLDESKIVSWEEYYSNEFKTYIKATRKAAIEAKIDRQSISEKVEYIYNSLSDPMILFSIITSSLPNNQINTDTTLDVVLDNMKSRKDIITFEGYCIKKLEVHKTRGEGMAKGSELATILANIISDYYNYHTANKDEYYDTLYWREFERLIDEYEPTDEDRTMFDSQNRTILENLYRDYVDKMKKDIEAYKAEIEAEKVKQSLNIVEVVESTPSDAANNVEEVEKFEKFVYASHGSTVYDYLFYALYPHMFMEGPLAKLAKYFRAKLSTGAYKFSNLLGANFAYYLPEIAMNKKLTDTQYEFVSNALTYILHYEISTIIDSYINMLQPTAKVTSNSKYTYEGVLSFIDSILNYPEGDSFKSLLVDPATVCQDDTKTGQRYAIFNNKYMLDPETRAKAIESIPEEDMAICYDGKDFTCMSVRDVMLSIARGDYLNPITGKKYPEDFVKRMEMRGAKILPTLKQPLEADPLPEKSVAAPIIQKPKTPIVQVQKQSPKRVRHIAPKKAEFEEIVSMLLLGDLAVDYDTDILFGNLELGMLIMDEGKKIEHTIEITLDTTDKKANVSVISFDFRDVKNMMDVVSKQIKSIPPNIKRVYAIGLNADPSIGAYNLKARQYSYNIQTKHKIVKNVFYVKSSDKKDIRDGLIDVVIDMEGRTIAE